MKKLFSALLLLGFAVGMIAPVAYAAERDGVVVTGDKPAGLSSRPKEAASNNGITLWTDNGYTCNGKTCVSGGENALLMVVTKNGNAPKKFQQKSIAKSEKEDNPIGESAPAPAPARAK